MKKLFQKKNKKNFSPTNRGFTLVETLVAISIFVASVLAMLVILSSGVKDVNYVKQNITATYLAQEGLEYFRNIRDNEMLSASIASDGWQAFTSKVGGCTDATPCDAEDTYLQTGSGNIISPCLAPIGCELYLSPAGKYINSSSPLMSVDAKDSGYSRAITVSIGSDTNMLKVTSTVSWQQGSGGHSVSFTEDLFNWYQ